MAQVELELYLVRHGQSRGNVGDWDDEDPPLTEKGERQAELLGEWCRDLPLDCIYVSGLRRALQTASEVAKRQPENGVGKIEVHKIFTECEVSEQTEGRTLGEIAADFPLSVEAPGTTAEEKIIWHSKGEPDSVHLERGKQALSMIRERFHSGEKVMVVAHAALNTFLLFAALGISGELVFDPVFHNTSITKIVFYKQGEGPYADVHLVYQNAVPHLLSEMPEFRI